MYLSLMPRKPLYWTRKLGWSCISLSLCDNETSFETQITYSRSTKPYADFAAKLGRRFTARSVRDRWVNKRGMMGHNVRRIDRSRETAKTPVEVYVPCWPLWKALQF